MIVLVRGFLFLFTWLWNFEGTGILNPKRFGDNNLKIPFLNITHLRDHFQIGSEMGSFMKNTIQKRVSNDKNIKEISDLYNERSEYKIAVDSIIDYHKKKYPDYYEELRGIASGSGVDLQKIWIINLKQYLKLLLKNETVTASCTDILINSPNGNHIIAHNEDDNENLENTGFLIQANPTGDMEWTAFVFAGELATSSWGFNKNVLFSLNALFVTQEAVFYPGVGRNFVSRDLLESTGWDDAINRIGGEDIAIGHSYNMFIEHNKKDDVKVVNVETAPKGFMAIYYVKKGETYFHANNYRRLQNYPYLFSDTSSVHRDTQASKYEPPKTMDECLNILGDTNDTAYPLFRNGKTDHVITLSTSVFDLKARLITIFQGNPREKKVVAKLEF